MYKKTKADISQIETIGGMQFGIPVVEKVEAKEVYGFLDPNIEPKAIFQGVNEITSNEGGLVFSELKANKFYTYALVYALLKKANDIIVTRAGEEKPKSEKIDERVGAALKEWKEENKEDDRYFTSIAVLSPATRYYSGKQGVAIAESAGLDKLSDGDLVLIANLCATAKGEASSSAKSEEDSPWVSERKDMTPEGWRQYETIKYEKMHDFNLIDDQAYEDKMTWIEEFDFHRGWNFAKQEEEIEVVTVDNLSEKALASVLEFNKYFCLNAINKDKLFVVNAEASD